MTSIPFDRDYLYLSPPDVGATERRLLLEAFDRNWIAPVGPDIIAFEREMADTLGASRCVAVSSGTAALHLTLKALGVGPYDRVLIPSFTFAATANAVCYLGATPVFLDCDRDTWTLDPQLVADEFAASAQADRPPAAVVTVDLYGQCADYAPILDLCAQYGVVLVEDAAESLGSTYGGASAGTFGAAGVLSFNGNKIITTGGGGMVVTENHKLADEILYLSTQARDPVRHYEHRAIGYNYRLSNILAAIGRGQLMGLTGKVAARQETNRFYRWALDGVPGIEFMPQAGYGESNCWLSCVLIDSARFGATRDDVAEHLEKHSIESRPLWKPMHLQPAVLGSQLRGRGVCEQLFRDGLCLPSGSSLSAESRSRVVDVLLSVPRRSGVPEVARVRS
jgi:dTDP-4-amino-4,6-dideoxygalactose transaminase